MEMCSELNMPHASAEEVHDELKKHYEIYAVQKKVSSLVGPHQAMGFRDQGPGCCREDPDNHSFLGTM
jgi:hypothetical protein